MGPSVDRNVHTVSGSPVANGPRLPTLDAPDHQPAGIDRVGAVVRTYAAPLVAGTAVGAMIGGITGVGGGAGALAGSAAGLVGGYMRGRIGAGAHVPTSTVARPVADERLRVMEFNVHGGMGGPGKFFATPTTLAHLADTIRQQNPDVVLLQELDHFATRSNYTDTLRQLAKRLHADGAVMSPAIDKGTGRREGTGVLTFNGNLITDARSLRIGDVLGDDSGRRLRATVDAWAGVVTPRLGGRKLPFGGVIEYQPRVATDVMIRTAGHNSIRVLSGHFSPPHDGVDEPRRQVDPIVATLETWMGPTIFGADFNVRDGSAEFDREHEVFAAAGMTEATAGAPPNSDRVYVSDHFAAENPQKLDTPKGAVPASDHSPVVVELTLRT
ncbi:endonuclease/exonuclease/phosphatase family metal-dependent hydrolase [Williamsia limnetica]|uniref:Endonuclease/exonuclease/phosphatase family metal-dependent hydrolase n=1 Tax=Williamsia limnetica TaxID=882452 RepID=A0A318RP12_WILLI|nr:endonuclease/exonuclease/phosphatase family protein [Williamsia limnetica]PYE20648.1 endonuclease/exonuclease/phosphatase family metal-dependent hydrolase [Williamsia limnetica]